MGNPPKILVFDSGVGGLSVLLEIRRQLPGCDYIYACDNEAFPYGTKQEDALIQRVDQVLKTLIRKVEPDIVVVACNTASTVALPRIRTHFTNPVVGVVPAIKPAATAISASKTIGLLGTPGTVSRQYTQQLIDDFAHHCKIIRVGSSELVELTEAKLRGASIDLQQLADITAPFFEDQTLDTIVLACTHFPLLLEELQAVASRPVNWVDSADAIARRVSSLLSEKQLPEQRRHQTTDQPLGFSCLVTAEHSRNKALLEQLITFGCNQMNSLTVPHTL